MAAQPGASADSGIDLSALAAAARRGLGGDVLVIVLLDGDRPDGILASEGLTSEQRERLGPVLGALAGELATGDPVSLPATASAAAAAQAPPLFLRHAPLLRHGYLGALGAAAPLASGRTVAVVALWREMAFFENEELVTVFAAQAATALDQPVRQRRLLSVTDRLEGLAALERLVLAGTTLEALAGALNDTVAPLVGATRTGVMLWDERRQVLRLLPGSFGASAASAASCVISAEDFRSNSARVFSTGRGYLSNDVGLRPALFKDFVDVVALSRVLSVPLSLTGRPIGVLHLADKARDFTVDDLDRAEVLAPKIATVVEIAQAHHRLRAQRRLEEVLSNVAVALASGAGIREFLIPTFEELGDVTDAALLALVPDDGPPVVWRRGGVAPRMEEEVLAEAHTRPGVRAYVVGPTGPGDPGWAAFHVPVQLDGQHVGTLLALRDRAEPFAEDERHAVVRLARLAALARTTERYQQQRAELARLHERQRIAEDLHDDVAQLLFAAQLSLDATLERDGLDGTVADGISQARGLLVRGDTAIRTVISRLATPLTADLALRLASAVAHVEDAFGQVIHLEVSDEAAMAGAGLDRDLGDVLVQVAREAMAKAAGRQGRHRMTVTLELTPPSLLVLTVDDDGVDDDVRDTRDLTPVRRRLTEVGGLLRVRHHPTGGTEVRAALPV